MAESSKSGLSEGEISLYCKHLLENITRIKGITGDGENEIALSGYQETCLRICKDIDDENSAIMTGTSLCECLQTITQLVMDVTFVEESSLIDQPSPTESSFRKIIETLQGVEDLCNRVVQDQSVLDVLGSDIIECLRWRKGALLYMYCHTLTSQFTMDNMPLHFSQCLEDGVKFLISMFCTRSPPSWLTSKLLKSKENDSCSEVNDEADILLVRGILSDTHLLALMYCGEMCYWHTTQRSLPETSKPCKDPQSADTETATGGSSSLESHFDQVCSDTHGSTCRSESSTGKTQAKTGLSVAELVSSSSPVYCAGSGTLEAGETVDIATIGQLCLENYVEAARGPMLNGSWKTARAEEILQYLSNYKR